MTYKRKEVRRVLGEVVSLLDFPDIIFIYAIEALDGNVVYIGSTNQPIKHRVRSHISKAKQGSLLPIHSWMRQTHYKLRVRFLEQTIESERHMVEKKWLKQFKNCLNVTDGGPGMSGHKFAGSAHARKIGEGLRTGDTFNCDTCSNQFWRKQRDILQGNNRFCSRDCYHDWQRGRPKRVASCR